MSQGADVNSGKHRYQYSALHFAALSGNPVVCRLLLAAGAKSELVNSVGRTASQMGAFVGTCLTPDGTQRRPIGARLITIYSLVVLRQSQLRGSDQQLRTRWRSHLLHGAGVHWQQTNAVRRFGPARSQIHYDGRYLSLLAMYTLSIFIEYYRTLCSAISHRPTSIRSK